MTARYPSVSIINLTYMVAVYIIVPDIIIKFISGRLRSGRSPLFTKLIYSHIIKYLLNDLIIFYKGDYFHLFPAPGTDKRIHLIYLLYEPGPGPVQSFGAIIFYNMILGIISFFFESSSGDIAVCSIICPV